MNTDTIFSAALALPEHDRATLADLLLATLDTALEQDVREASLEEVERRRGAYLRGEIKTVSYEDAMREAKARAAS